ncbi:MAG: S-layer homology domain-containing protein [Syntrophomonas sp.]|uniref:alpha/beta fold hydrolase n=1 Tax=Syntrophomonas sp. TaxID=2053627 RepID=UPI00263069A2|nr:alpha/beta fold hydrolase [Syntrophomonas sp.]MDD2510760.1 S-layer homology domain-containing protein [Syntrophomonas sp.]MDD3878871.1 S-layer homology domain-containing protein [Syntrophomonas sp.]MDD4625544.1 S-layer homology domain-containing protein [Syntrophomonas sp.]
MSKSLKNIFIYSFTFLLLLILTGIATAAPQQEAIVTAFYDVSSSDANLVYINYMAKRDIISGFPDGSFHPSEGLTRAQAAVLVSKVSGQKAKPGNSSFSDIDSSHWAANYINSAVAAKYIAGFPDGSFHPDEILTRAQGISLLLRLSEQSLTEAELPQLQDVDPNHWAAAAIATAIAAGMIDTENNTFKPDQAFNRGDLTRSLSLLLTKAPDLNRQELTGQLIIKTGTVKLKRDGSEKTQPLNTTTTVRAGDTLITANDGEAEINYPDGSGILLKPNSQLIIKTASGRAYIVKGGEPGTAVDKLEIELTRGQVFGALASKYTVSSKDIDEESIADNKFSKIASRDNHSKLAAAQSSPQPWYKTADKKKDKIKIAMPWGVTAIHGSFWSNHTSSSSGSMSLLQGEASLTSGGVTRNLSPGQSSVSGSDSRPPSLPHLMSPSEARGWTQQRSWLGERAAEMQSQQEAGQTGSGSQEQGADPGRDLLTYKLDQALAQAEQTAAGAASGSSGGGDKQTPDSFIDMESFLKMAIPYITFEQGEDPGYIAKKQGFIKDEPRGEVYRDDILYSLLRMTYVPIPPDADLLQLAKEYGIISENDKTIQEENIKITANTALQMMINARNAWYERLEAEKPAEQLNLINYYISNSTYTYPEFIFSDDGQVLWYTERGELKAITVSDASKSDQVPSNGSPKEEYPAQDGESAINIYDNSQVLRAVSIELSKRRNYVTDKYILYRESPEKPWKRLIEFDLSLTRDYEIIGFTADNTKMIVKTNFYDNYASLYQVDPKTMSRELIYHNPHADVAVELISVLAGTPVVSLKNPETGELLTAIYIDDKTRLVCLRDEMASIMDNVRADLGENQFPVAISPDFDYLVLLHRDDRDYGSYRLYNVESRKDTLLLSSDIPVKDVGHTYPVSFKASDGQTVFGYLTLPLGKSPRNLPLIVNVHGGPQARYVWTPNEYALLVSNLDIGVLSVDFRFSIGYGNEYTDSASQNMLLAQQDVFESVNWAINNGIADPECIGIMGHSYGGYISFYQAAVHPDAYKAVISLMGVWDWTDLGLELIEDDPVPDYHRCSAPEPGTELAQVLSPSSYADKLKSPILIIYAGQDDAVYPSQNIRAIKELTEAGNTPQVLYLPDSGHTPDTLENITAVFEEIKSFLNEQMKATMSDE